MPYIIDGHNLIPKIRSLSLKDIDDEIQLIEHLRSFLRGSSKKIEVYFDNAPPGSARVQNHGRVTAHFVRQGRTADDAIRARLTALGRSAQTWTVVSSDREVLAAAREARAKVLRSEAFAKQLSLTSTDQKDDQNTEPQLSAQEVDEWLRLFDQRKR
ncbi:MAG: NYN domain-containing protein [Chloroflexota bacterium]